MDEREPANAGPVGYIISEYHEDGTTETRVFGPDRLDEAYPLYRDLTAEDPPRAQWTVWYE